METLTVTPDIQTEPIRHRGVARIAWRFPFDRAVIREVKTLLDRRNDNGMLRM
ncbi:MAG: hypothetical protein M3Q56_10655 [Bacteroidota bacterium]|nr:hypothetical protein [Bacteroidota bacterium]